MFNKILIANRGEIACRVITTAKRLGIRTVAVFSDADARAKHVALSDEAYHIGPSAVNESYLLGDKLIEIALKSGAQAIHPGYGFLSENPEFVDAVEAAGLTFIGPSSSAIRAMGLKDAAKVLMIEAGVPVVPGYHGENQDPVFLAAEADKIGYPVLIKARAGGGGKGMRLVEDPKDFAASLEGAQREGLNSFGDASCLIEKYITQPRHIEIQVFGDNHGNAVHLFERDCSLQRRHQKVIEEAPAPDMPDDVRAAMGAAAINAAKAINYSGAGTVEFIVDGSDGLRADGFWFMEMNTRLQVEHPVSEAITGLDFVELQLRVAAGEVLPVKQEALSIKGWSFEARLYAEDVPGGFLPSTGTLDHLQFPAGSAFEKGAVRIDSGVREGDEISPFYDPMIAKVIVHGDDRASALNALTTVLQDCQISGSTTNLDFLVALSRHAGFSNGEVDTNLIARDLTALTAVAPSSEPATALAAVAALGVLAPQPADDPWVNLVGWQQWGTEPRRQALIVNDQEVTFNVTILSPTTFEVSWSDATLGLEVIDLGEGRYDIAYDDYRGRATVFAQGDDVSVFMDGKTERYTIPQPNFGAGDDDASSSVILSPMPGSITKLDAVAGQTVAAGDALIVIEAMKMEHTLAAPRDGVIAEVLVEQGDQVDAGAVVIRLELLDE
ncbi:MAG: acetyl/propionyl/methylcrotonyl-CoA carboxylase subunit alpha [Pacificibacter sp.]|uniref:acetyl/propionyl/methylcrotonyl-CoA carboxylase subunit alpha n=1 Tax=Pacificibacter sp. TaxID=1917866 RepID=UPI00321B0B73